MVPNILSITRDSELDFQICETLDFKMMYTPVRSSSTAEKLLQENSYDIVFVDEEIYVSREHHITVHEWLENIYNAILRSNPRTIVVLIVNEKNYTKSMIKKQNASTMVFYKDYLNFSKLAYMIDLLKKHDFRSVLLRDLQPGFTAPCDIFIPDEKDGYKLQFKKDMKLTEQGINGLKDRGHHHVYVKRLNLGEFFEGIDKALKHKFQFSYEIAEIRDQFKSLICELCDDSYPFLSSNGQKIYQLAETIVDRIVGLIERYPTLKAAAEELPFPRGSLLSHLFNTTIYSYVFGKSGLTSRREREIAIAAVFHDCGLSNIEFEILLKHKSNLSWKDKFIIEKHVEQTIEVLQRKYVPASEDLKNLILTHHEHYDGTGFPKGLSKDDMTVEQGVLPIADEFDRIRIVLSGKKERDFDEAWEEIKSRNSKSALGGKFNGHLIKDIEKALQDLSTRNTAKKAS
jgi:hypothetical protein